LSDTLDVVGRHGPIGPGGETLTGLVLSGGGTRGAYEVGVLAGFLEALDATGRTISPFQILAGTSVGAINAAFLAANADAPGFNLERLIGAWTGLDFSKAFNPQLLSFFRQLFKGTSPPAREQERLGVSMLDPLPLEQLVQHNISFDALHDNIQSDVVRGLIIAALDVSSGKTVLFCEFSPNGHYKPSKDPRRTSSHEPITLEHILASAAIPILFPARRVGKDFYCDGGLRFNTPISPVIRSGAERLVIVSTTYMGKRPVHAKETLATYPSLAFLTGKVLNALLLDPLEYDLQVLARINGLVDLHHRGLAMASQEELERLLEHRRGAPYRHIETLVFSPSQDIAKIAADYLKDNLKRFDIGLMARRLLRTASEEENADWATYLLFDGGFTERIIELGRQDALRNRDQIRAFCRA
jgi:NTE family protein